MSEVIKNLEAFINTRFPNKLVEGVTDACMDIRNEAVTNITESDLVDSGDLISSITFEVEQSLHGVEGAVGTAKEYAIYIHEGTGLYAKSGNGRKEVPWHYQTTDGNWHSTKGVYPTPFLQDAADKIRPNFLDYFKGVCDD